jgi:hypothetical protein
VLFVTDHHRNSAVLIRLRALCRSNGVLALPDNDGIGDVVHAFETEERRW